MVASRQGIGRGRVAGRGRGHLRRRRRRPQPRDRAAGKATQSDRARGGPTGQRRAARGGGHGQRSRARSSTWPISRRRRSSRRAWPAPPTRSRPPASTSSSPAPSAPRRHAAGDLRRPRAGRGDPRREVSDTRVRWWRVPGRDLRVRAGDWTAMIGTADELRRAGHRRRASRSRTTRRRTVRAVRRRDRRGLRAFRDDINPMFYSAFAASMTLLLCATVLLRFTYHQPPGMSWIDALYFSHRDDRHRRIRRLQLPRPADLAAAVRHRADVRGCHHDRDPGGLRRRPAAVATASPQSAGRRRVRDLQNHIIVVGLGSFGIRVSAIW